MTKSEVINHITSDSFYKKSFKKIARNAGWHGVDEDLFQEIVLALLEYPDEKIITINPIKPFVLKIACNMVSRANKSSFHKKYTTIFEDENSIPDKELEPEKKEEQLTVFYQKVLLQLKRIESDYGNRFPFDLRILEAYIHHGSQRKISIATGIPLTTVHQSLTRIKKIVKQNVNPANFID